MQQNIATLGMALTYARADQLRSAGFPVKWVSYDETEPPDYVSWFDSTDFPEYVDHPQLWVNLESVARGTDVYDQTTTVDRSNFRSLQRDYPDIWLNLHYSNVDVLGALVRNLTDDVIETLCDLKEIHSVYDEDDLCKLEDEEITESYADYVRHDIRSMLPDSAQEQWDELSSEADEALFWEVVRDKEIYPEHSGLEVRWNQDHLQRIADEITVRLAQMHRES